MDDLRLKNAPIVEAVLDIECEMPSGQELSALETTARDSYRDKYPIFRTGSIHEHFIDGTDPKNPSVSIKRTVLQAFQFLHDDEKQLIQVRRQGYSFNRLAPYSSLDDYSPEIERTWKIYVSMAKPKIIQFIRLRYINRIFLPSVPGENIQLADYLRVCPHLPDEEKLTFVGFLNQHAAIESETGNQVNIVLASQSAENNHLPVILDITTVYAKPTEPMDWESINKAIKSLRHLKNEVFRNTITEKCTQLFQ